MFLYLQIPFFLDWILNEAFSFLFDSLRRNSIMRLLSPNQEIDANNVFFSSFRIQKRSLQLVWTGGSWRLSCRSFVELTQSKVIFFTSFIGSSHSSITASPNSNQHANNGQQRINPSRLYKSYSGVCYSFGQQNDVIVSPTWTITVAGCRHVWSSLDSALNHRCRK